jgi:hypothetical protein
MGESELYSAGEAFEMRFVSADLETRSDPLRPTAHLGWIASAIGDAFELFGYDGMIFPFLGR